MSQPKPNPKTTVANLPPSYTTSGDTILIARIFGDDARYGALPRHGTLRLKRARGTVGRATAIGSDLACQHGASIRQPFVVWAAVDVGIGLESEGVAGEEPVALSRPVDHRHMWRDA